MVPKLCIGTGTYAVGGLSQQAMVPMKEYAEILSNAFNNGLNFWDTSDNYGTHPHIKEAFLTVSRKKVVLSTKTHAKNNKEIRHSVERSLKELDTNYIDILFMHGIDTLEDLEKQHGALLELIALKAEGIIKAVGISTHSYPILEKLVIMPEIDIILTNYNKFEDHMDASLEAYSKALQFGFDQGKGILVMKTLGEGRLAHYFKETMLYNLSQPFIHSVLVGITTQNDLKELLTHFSSCLII